MDNKKILVIGAGPAGLSALKGLNQLKPRDEYKIVCI
jgi:cation diffusion facilitator CzcD-associated flavoprotein CzcO